MGCSFSEFIFCFTAVSIKHTSDLAKISIGFQCSQASQRILFLFTLGVHFPYGPFFHFTLQFLNVKYVQKKAFPMHIKCGIDTIIFHTSGRDEHINAMQEKQEKETLLVHFHIREEEWMHCQSQVHGGRSVTAGQADACEICMCDHSWD